MREVRRRRARHPRVAAQESVTRLAAGATLIAALAVGLFAGPFVAGAQPPDKVHRIGHFSIASRGPFHQASEQALGERGWGARKNPPIESRFAHDNYEPLSALAGELIRLEPQVIVAIPTAAARTVRNATSTIP